MQEKKVIRKEIKEKLLSISKPIYEHQSFMIAQSLQEDPFWVNANTIGITISNFPEVDTYQIIRRAWEQGKRVVVPKCIPEGKKMDFRQLKQFNQLESVYFGLYEPMESLTLLVDPKEIDLIIVPGLAFDKSGYRIGFGGGYYDRFLENFKGHTLSLCFSEQIVECVPTEVHDIPVEKTITNEGSYTVK
jgi:5-formyltetrahydrofolate cyclo-ligase